MSQNTQFSAGDEDDSDRDRLIHAAKRPQFDRATWPCDSWRDIVRPEHCLSDEDRGRIGAIMSDPRFPDFKEQNPEAAAMLELIFNLTWSRLAAKREIAAFDEFAEQHPLPHAED